MMTKMCTQGGGAIREISLLPPQLADPLVDEADEPLQPTL